MIKLNGTEKQIVWAEQIREIILNGSAGNEGIVQYIKRYEKSMMHYEEKYERKGKNISECKGHKSAMGNIDLFKSLKNKVESEESSVWFIDNRNNFKLFTKKIFSK